jgi:hypothetical protein
MFENDNDRQQIVYKNTSIIIALEAMEAYNAPHCQDSFLAFLS